ncbi:hypothetical protein KI387_018481, partial [Taxus chinensis]
NVINMEMGANSAEPSCLKYNLLLLSWIFVLPYTSCYSIQIDGGHTLPLGVSLTGNQTIMSKNGMFAMGFFSPRGTHNWYVGIWYAQVSQQIIVWVANRASPVRNMAGVLNLSRGGRHLRVCEAAGGNLVSRGVLLDSGNFVLLGRHNRSETVWESFDHPTHAWLPGMKIAKRHKFISWKNSLDPAPGVFSVRLDPSGLKQFVFEWNDSVQYCASGVWNGHYFSKVTEFPREYGALKFKFDVGYVSYTVLPEGEKVHNHLAVDKDGQVGQYAFIDGKWTMIGAEPRDQCRVFGICGAYGTCNPNNFPFCSCVQGFQPADDRAWNSHEWWSSGCVRRNPLQCSATTDGFLQLIATWLPDEQAVSHMEEKTPDGCRAACFNNCSCNAFALTATATASPVCRLWFGDLLNIRHSCDGRSLFIRVAASDLPQPSSNSSRLHVLVILIPVGTGLATILAVLFTRLKRLRLHSKGGEDAVEMFPRAFTYKELQIATRNFKDKLGSGGFGSVFRGTLPDGLLVGVKRLEGTVHGEKQFRAEISTVGNIQHVNLVRLQGFCAQGSQRLLVYDYMPNGSLNSFLFSNNNQAGKAIIPLDWKTRFKIALGTARALVYLHEECRDRIIHCDIKPENILLDEYFCPKVADFGLAKLMGRDFSRVLTTTRGTRGYLAPEWISGMPITAKADVYSFGMTLFEIISGRRNLDLDEEESSRIVFPPWALAQIAKGNIMGVVDSKIVENAEDVEE